MKVTMNKFLRAALVPVAAALTLAASASFAAVLPSAAVLTSHLSVDNGYSIFLSTADNVQGTSFGSGNNWTSTFTNTKSLVAGTSYFLHVYAYDQGGIAGFLGDFSLSGTSHKFANGQAFLTTNTTDWKGNNSGFGSAYGVVGSLGNDGVGPWGNRPNIADSATWIWAGHAWNNDQAYFTARIDAVNAVPEPTTVAMLGLGLLALGAARRRSEKASKKA